MPSTKCERKMLELIWESLSEVRLNLCDSFLMHGGFGAREPIAYGRHRLTNAAVKILLRHGNLNHKCGWDKCSKHLAPARDTTNATWRLVSAWPG